MTKYFIFYLKIYIIIINLLTVVSYLFIFHLCMAFYENRYYKTTAPKQILTGRLK